jgi:ABC-type methionine transport system ATPase subunit
MRMYKTNPYGISITEVEVLRITEKFAVIQKGKKERRESLENYYKTPEEAIKNQIERVKGEVVNMNAQIDYLNRCIEKSGETLELLYQQQRINK